MSTDDPFAGLGDSDSTFIKPTPGGRFAPAAQAAPVSDPLAVGGYVAHVDLPTRTGLNPLENAASNLLDLAVGLKNTHSHPDVAGLHRQLLNEIKEFENQARRDGASEQTVKRAQYVLCATLDDIILNTPWGQQFGWASKTLQGTVFRKEWGGDEFFKLLDLLVQDPSNNLDLIELMYICIALGFKGGYRVYDRQNQLEERREQIYRILRKQRGEIETALSPHWEGVKDDRNPVIRYLPLWVLTALLGLLLMLIYFFFWYRLNNISDPLHEGLQTVGRDVVLVSGAATPSTSPTSTSTPTPPPTPEYDQVHAQLRQKLLSENCVDTGDVVIGKAGGGQQVVGTYLRTNVNCKALFDSGRWDLKPSFLDVINRIGGLIGEVVRVAPGRILITGHTDSIPGSISNAELSQRRADAVMQELVRIIGSPGRFRAEGRAEREPIADNKTADGRARNRRVEIMLLYPYVDL